MHETIETLSAMTGCFEVYRLAMRNDNSYCSRWMLCSKQNSACCIAITSADHENTDLGINNHVNCYWVMCVVADAHKAR